MNAIILAAGLGLRLRPLTTDVPKPLVSINGIKIIERQIICLHEVGIKDIHIVTGYKQEMFFYLKLKFGVNLIYNLHFKEYNNIYSLYLAKAYLENTYILDGDIFIYKNFLSNHLKSSTYFSREKNNLSDEWILKFNDKKLNDIIVYNNLSTRSKSKLIQEFVISGISFWIKADSDFIKKQLNELIGSNGKFKEKNYKDLYWDYIIFINKRKLSIQVIKLEANDCYEVDNLQDLEELKRIVYRL